MSEVTNPYFHTHQLSNGLQIVGQSMPDFESVALCFYGRTGARDEEDTLVAGISHFLEHMIFKGTKTLDWQQLKQEFNRSRTVLPFLAKQRCSRASSYAI